jgi:recombination protein RecR
MLLIVEKDADFETIKRSKTYKGMYFILGGLVPIVTKDMLNFVRTKELSRIIEDRATHNNLSEVVIALSLNPQGEHTDMYLREILSSLQVKYSFRIVSLGRGLSTGTELEYSDSETIKNALQNRL